MSDNLLFMIEGEPILSVVREHIAARTRVRTANQELLAPLHKEYDVDRASTDRETGVILAVVFPKGAHPEFTKPKGRGGMSYPKKGTDWAKRFAAQQGHPNQCTLIAGAFDIPLSLGYKTADGEGWRCIGNMLAECGFLYLSADGPYALWIPDVPGEVAKEVAQGRTVDEKCAAFRAELAGCRRMEPEEWDILVAQHKLAQKRAAAPSAGQTLPAETSENVK